MAGTSERGEGKGRASKSGALHRECPVALGAGGHDGGEGARWRKAGGARSVGATDSFVCEWDRENSHDQGLPFPSAGAGKRVYGGDPRADEDRKSTRRTPVT